MGAPRWVMARVLVELDETYAGIEGYLLGPGGMRTATLAALRAVLVSQHPQASGCRNPNGGNCP